MSQEKHALLLVVISAALFLLSGCGSGTNSQDVSTLSPQQAAGAAVQVEQTLIGAVDGMTSNFCPKPPFGQEWFCTIPVASEVACAGGGTAGYTGSLLGNMDFTLSGGTSGALTFVPANCSIPGSNFVMTAKTTLALASTVNFFYGGPSYISVAETGSIVYGSDPKQVCSTNLNVTASIEGDAQHTLLSCTLNGTACGQTINQSCL